MQVISQYNSQLALKGYSLNTVETYCCYFKKFLFHLGEKKIEVEKASKEDIMAYLEMLVFDKGISPSLQNQTINAIKFYYEKVLFQERRTYFLERPFKAFRLPKVLTKEEIRCIMGNTNNLKHRCILQLGYSSGLRIGEVLNLRIIDIDSERMMIKVNQGKGRKDRYSILSNTLLKSLREYYKMYRPKEFLFESPQKEAYSATSVQNILKRAARKGNIHKNNLSHVTT